MPGLDVDLDLGPIEIMAGVRAELATLNKHNAAQAEHRRRETQRARMPSDVRMISSAAIPTPTQRTGINLGGPDPGFYWLLRRLIIGGTAWKTVAAGTGEVYVTALGGQQGSAIVGPMIAGLALSDIVDQASALPFKNFYSNKQVIVQEQENLLVVIDTGTAAQQYVVTAQFEVWRTISTGIEASA